MPTTLALEYNIARYISVPNALAKKLKENEDVEWGEPWSWYVKYLTLYYCDGDKKKHEIQCCDDTFDYKRDDGQEWLDPDESDEE
jgi:hypothetical protein